MKVIKMEFKNLKKKLQEEYQNKVKETFEKLDNGKMDIENYRSFYNIPKNVTTPEKIKKAIERYYKKGFLEELRKIETTESVENFEDKFKDSEYVIEVEWSKNRVWGFCPKATDNLGNKSGLVGGSGYDKLSTAVALVLNKNPYILKERL